MGRQPFIAIEGTDGSGKTTIRQHLYRELRDRGIDVLTTTGYSWIEPEHTEVMVRARFHDVPYPPERLVDAYVGDKASLTRRIIDPHLEHRVVISDRYVHSDMVQLLTKWGVSPNVSRARYAGAAVRFPDLVVFVDTPPETAVRRLESRTARLHPWEALEPLKQVYAAFRHVLFEPAVPDFGPIVAVDNTGDRDTTLESVLGLVLGVVADAAEPG